MTPGFCGIVRLPTIRDPRGNLSVVENDGDAEWAIDEIFCLSDLPVPTGGEETNDQPWSSTASDRVVVAARGRLTVRVEREGEQRIFLLDRGDYALVIRGPGDLSISPSPGPLAAFVLVSRSGFKWLAGKAEGPPKDLYVGDANG